MWARVQQDLATILSDQSFHVLFEDSEYMRLFRNAGMPNLLPTNPADLRPAMRTQLAEAARMCAQLVTMEVQSMQSVRERRAKAVVLKGPKTMYRLWSQRHGNRTGGWWFTQGVLEQALASGAGNRSVTLEWLRDRLAISFDWSDCDRIARLVLHYEEDIPAVEAWGLPVRQFSKAAAGQPGVVMKEYWTKYDAMFQGQKTQYFLPFVPASRITDYW